MIKYNHYKKSTNNKQTYINKSQFQKIQPNLILKFKYTLTKLPQYQLLTIFNNIRLKIFFRYIKFLITNINKTISPKQSYKNYYLQILKNLTPF